MSAKVGTDSTDDTLFNELSAENDNEQMKVESLCVQCGKNGITRLLCTKIPFYRKIIVISFNCEHCGNSNNELQSGEPVQEDGIQITLSVTEPVDLNRQVVKSEYAEVELPELELTIPSKSQAGEITTVEGIIRRVIAGLDQDQERRHQMDPEGAEKIDRFIQKLEGLLTLEDKFTLKIRDISGNSYVQNPDPFHIDPKCSISYFKRNRADKVILGIIDDVDDQEPETSGEFKSLDDAKNEVLRFSTRCPNCNAIAETNMKPTDIPFFSTVIIICSTCDACGWKSSEVKSGAGVRDRGCKLVLLVEKQEDLKRDVLKSDTCCMSIPELDLEVGPGALSGRFTTVEGLLIATKEQLSEQCRFLLGDSGVEDKSSKMQNFLQNFDLIKNLQKNVHIVLDDPSGNSYIQSLSDYGDDERLKREFYERSYEQNEELGFNDMKTENYGELDIIKEEAE